ncbi:MAG: sigma-54-dependent Fis family transcriptional regulator [Deltaproteobacteria bacterium]|nr:sigma-54-dependent Fis family transcriptional regulator [Deltaproteobacteria bacterium]
MRHRLLIVEDEPNYRAVLRMMLTGLDVELLEAGDGAEALSLLERADVDLIVTDLNMPNKGGMELLRELRAKGDHTPVVVVTAYTSIEGAVEAMRAGAIDYLQKPFDEERLRLTMGRALRMTELLAENRRLRDAVESRYRFEEIVGESEGLVAALRTVGKVAASEGSVLIRGESGTGKELVARAIHFNSRRAGGPFIAVNSAALPDTLLEAELFGAEAGAFTGAAKRRKGRVELARGGTLFLDEIGDMPAALQVKLLRLLQERTFTPLGAEAEQKADVRFVFATHKDLAAEVKAGRFREDLFYRVNVLSVTLPPLRERGDDVLALAERFARQTAEQMGRRAPALGDAARQSLLRYPFPGNVRELANVIERAVILCDSDVLTPHDLELPAAAPSRSAGQSAAQSAGQTAEAAATTPELFRLPEHGVSLDELEASLVRQALERTGGNKSRAARLLGLTRATLRYRLEKLGESSGEGDA